MLGVSNSDAQNKFIVFTLRAQCIVILATFLASFTFNYTIELLTPSVSCSIHKGNFLVILNYPGSMENGTSKCFNPCSVF